ncbi:MAG: ABC transporter permease [Gemmatimonadota bacterium]
MKRLVKLPDSAARADADADAELQFHLEGRIEELMARGMTREAAEQEALRRFGDRTRVHAEMQRIDAESLRRITLRERLHELLRDIRFATRTLLRRPIYTGAILATIALGVGANAAVFSAVYAVLVKPFDVPGISRLAVVRNDFPLMGLREAQLSPLEAVDLFARRDLFTTATAVGGEGATIEVNGEPTRATGAPTIGDFFGTFAVQPLLGRTYRAEDSDVGRPKVVVLSHKFWTQVSGDSAIVGTTLRIGETPYEVIGVLPATFGYPRSAMYWRPMQLDAGLLNQSNGRAVLITNFVGRMRDGMTVERLKGELKAIAEQWHRQYPAAYASVSDHSMLATSFVVAQAGDLRPIVAALLVAVTLVLLLACANVASLQLVRAASRARELAVRAALGAGRGAIVRALLVESTLLTVGGALLGLLAARAAVRSVRALDLAQYPVLNSLELSAPVLAFTAGIAILTGVLIGVAPGLRAMRTDVSAALRDSSRGSSGGAARHRLLRVSVVSQHALTLLLLVGAGLTMRSLDRLLRVDPGFVADDVVAFSVSLPQNSYVDAGQRLAFWQSFEEKLQAIPGVQSVGFGLGAPFTGAAGSTTYELPSVPARAGESRRHANQAFVFGDYFKTMGIDIVRGRALTHADGSSAASVMIVDETLVKQSFGSTDPIGATIVHGPEGTIIGVARSVKLADLTEEAHPLVYHNYGRAAGWVGSLTAVVRTTLPTPVMLKAARRALAELDPSIPIASGTSLRARIDDSLGPRRLSTRILGAFAALALVLAVLGVYAVMSHVVSDRTREIGIRAALGAQKSQIMAMVMREGLVMAAIGLAIGTVLFVAAGRLMQSLVFGVQVFDLLTLLGATLLIVGAAVGACWLPSRRAVRVDPARTLKAD